MKKIILSFVFLIATTKVFCWGFFAHQTINHHAVFLLPPEMLVWYKPNIGFIHDHAVDPDKRRYISPLEAPRHFIDIDEYGPFPFASLPRQWEEAVRKYSLDTLQNRGIVPWWILVMKERLTAAFRSKDPSKILKLSADIGHYIADAHVPLHVCSNHNGQLTHQEGIHAFWESRIPELLAEKEWDFFIGKADYIPNPSTFVWNIILESAKASDSVLRFEKELNLVFREELKYAFEDRNEIVKRQYSTAYTIAYNHKLGNMVERRMRQSIYAIASFWYTCWVDAGQPDLKNLSGVVFTDEEKKEMYKLDASWKTEKIKGFDCDK